MRFSTIASVLYGATAAAQTADQPTLLTMATAMEMQPMTTMQPMATMATVNPINSFTYAKQLYEHARALVQRAKRLVRDNPEFPNQPAFLRQPLRVPAGFEADNLVDQFNRLVFYLGSCNRVQAGFNFQYADADAEFEFVRGTAKYIMCVDSQTDKWLGRFDEFIIEEVARLTEWMTENPQFAGIAPAVTLANTNLLPPGWTRALLDMSPALHRILMDIRNFVRRQLQTPAMSADAFLDNYVSTTGPSQANRLGWPAGVSLPVHEIYDELVGKAAICSSPARRALKLLRLNGDSTIYDYPEQPFLESGIEECIAEELLDFAKNDGDLQKWTAKKMHTFFSDYEARFPTATTATTATAPAWNPFAAYPTQLSATGYRYSIPYGGNLLG